jgi:hypothetical protein
MRYAAWSCEILMMTQTASGRKTLSLRHDVFLKHGGRGMKMAETSTEGKLSKLVDTARELFHFVQEAAAQGIAIHEVEKGIWERMLAMGREALGQFLAYDGNGDVGEQVTVPDGCSWERLEEPHARWYQSIFGNFSITRRKPVFTRRAVWVFLMEHGRRRAQEVVRRRGACGRTDAAGRPAVAGDRGAADGD